MSPAALRRLPPRNSPPPVVVKFIKSAALVDNNSLLLSIGRSKMTHLAVPLIQILKPVSAKPQLPFSLTICAVEELPVPVPTRFDAAIEAALK